MQCPHQADLPAYVDAELSPAEVQRLEEHVRRCWPCIEELQLQRTVVERLNSMHKEAAPSDFSSLVLARLPPRGQTAAAGRSSLRAPAALAVLTGVLAVWSGSLPTGFFAATLGRLASWWYAWCGDLGGTLAWARSLTVVELQPIATSLWNAACAVGAALAPQVAALWATTFALGLGLHALARLRRPPVLPSGPRGLTLWR